MKQIKFSIRRDGIKGIFDQYNKKNIGFIFEDIKPSSMIVSNGVDHKVVNMIYNVEWSKTTEDGRPAVKNTIRRCKIDSICVSGGDFKSPEGGVYEKMVNIDPKSVERQY